MLVRRLKTFLNAWIVIDMISAALLILLFLHWLLRILMIKLIISTTFLLCLLILLEIIWIVSVKKHIGYTNLKLFIHKEWIIKLYLMSKNNAVIMCSFRCFLFMLFILYYYRNSLHFLNPKALIERYYWILLFISYLQIYIECFPAK